MAGFVRGQDIKHTEIYKNVMCSDDLQRNK